MSKERVLWFAIFILAALISLSAAWLPAPLSANAPANVFSAGRAFQIIEAIARKPHPNGSPENARVREFLFNAMRDLGLEPRQIKGGPNDPEIVDLYGELKGSDPALPAVLVVAHYDTTKRAPGAADDSTGVAVILETIRALKAAGPQRNSIGVLLTDGEEGPVLCRGAYAFVHGETELMNALRVVVNLEARGNRGPVLMFQTGPDNNGLSQLFRSACPLPVAASFSEEVYRRMPNDTDMTQFLLAGKRGYNFAFIGGLEFYHSAQDTPDNLSRRTLQDYGANVLPLVAKLAQTDGTTFDRVLQPGDATFFTLCRGLLVCYSAALARIFVYLTVTLSVVALFLRRKELKFGRIVISLGIDLLAMVLSAGIAFLVLVILERIYKPVIFGPFVVGIPHSAMLAISLLFFAAVLTVIIRSRLSRNATPTDRLVAALLPWLALTLATNQFLPGASYLFVWPTFFGALALATKKLATILTAVPAALLLSFTILLLHHTLTIGIAPVSCALVALALTLQPLDPFATR